MFYPLAIGYLLAKLDHKWLSCDIWSLKAFAAFMRPFFQKANGSSFNWEPLLLICLQNVGKMGPPMADLSLLDFEGHCSL